MDAPVDDYDEYTVDDAKDAVRDGDLDPAAALEYERATKERVTLTRWLENRLEDLEPQPVDADDGEPETVPVASTRKGSIAGIFFEYANDARVVERTARVEEAISDGDLRELDYEP